MKFKTLALFILMSLPASALAAGNCPLSQSSDGVDLINGQPGPVTRLFITANANGEERATINPILGTPKSFSLTSSADAGHGALAYCEGLSDDKEYRLAIVASQMDDDGPAGLPIEWDISVSRRSDDGTFTTLFSYQREIFPGSK